MGAVSFTKGTNAREIYGLLKVLARDDERTGEPVGLLPPDRIPSWEHTRVYPVGYDQLELKFELGQEQQEMDRATHLWLGLAQSALVSDEPLDPSASPDAKTLAGVIEGHQARGCVRSGDRGISAPTR